MDTTLAELSNLFSFLFLFFYTYHPWLKGTEWTPHVIPGNLRYSRAEYLASPQYHFAYHWGTNSRPTWEDFNGEALLFVCSILLYPGHSLLAGSLSVLDWRRLCDMIEHQIPAVLIASVYTSRCAGDEVEVELTGSLRKRECRRVTRIGNPRRG